MSLFGVQALFFFHGRNWFDIKTQKIESMHNGLILIAISWEILLSQVLSVLLQLYYSGSYFQKLKERHWLNSVRCLSKQTNRNNERGHSAVSTHTITKSLVEISSPRVAPVFFLHWPTVVPIRYQLVPDMSPSNCQIVPGLHNLLQPCSRASRKWRENEEMEWDSLSTFPPSLFPLFPPSLSISYISNLSHFDAKC